MERPIFKHPIESFKYMIHVTVPAIALGYIEREYKKTHDERLKPASRYFGDKLKGVINKHYSKIAPERIDKLIKQIDSLESLCDS